jgi:hypothetical protein
MVAEEDHEPVGEGFQVGVVAGQCGGLGEIAIFAGL